jgi:hypothetical protein
MYGQDHVLKAAYVLFREQHQKATLRGLPAAVELNQKSVLLIPEQAAHRFRDDAARLFRLIVARHSD